MRHQLIGDRAWVPSDCSLPTEDRPLPVAEFDDFEGHAHVLAALGDRAERLLA